MKAHPKANWQQRFMYFTVSTEGHNSLGLRELAQKFANKQWLPADSTPEQAAHVVLDQFKQAIESELQLLEIRVEA